MHAVNLSFTPQFPLLITLKQPKEWNDLMDGIPSLLQSQIEKETNNIVSSHISEIHEVVRLLEIGDWEHPLFDAAEISYYILAAYRIHLIPITTLATAMGVIKLFVTYGKENVKPVPLFNGSVVNPTAIKLINATMYDGKYAFLTLEEKNSGSQLDRELSAIRFLTDHQLIEMLNLMRHAPLCEQFLFLTPDPDGSIPYTKIKKNPPTTITQEIHCDLGINIFGRIPNQSTRMFASTELYEAYLKVRFGEENVPGSVITFGETTESKMADHNIENKRVLRIPGPKLPLDSLYPDVADCFKAKGIDFLEHDRYHKWRMCRVFRIQRPFITILALFYKKNLEKTNLQGSKFGRLIVSSLLDYELSYYKKEKTLLTHEEQNGIFWTAITELIQRIKSNIQIRLNGSAIKTELLNSSENQFYLTITELFLLYNYEIQDRYKISLMNSLKDPYLSTLESIKRISAIILS